MSWKKKYRSFYYQGAPEPEDIILNAAETALLVIDIQNKYMIDPDDPEESKRWAPFFERMNPQYGLPYRNLPQQLCRSYFCPNSMSEGGRSRSLAQPEETRLELFTNAQRFRGIPVRSGNRSEE